MIIKNISYPNWEKKIALEISKILKKKNNDIILTGGRSVIKVYKYFFQILKTKKETTNIFLSDERCLNASHPKLNSKLFKSISKLKNINFFPIVLKNKSFSECAKIYQKKITKKPSLVLLSLGEDGHLASIFFKSKALISNKNVIFENKIFNGFKRITITLKYLINKKIYIICRNKKRLKTFLFYMKKKNHILNILTKNNKFLTIFVKEKDFKSIKNGN